MPRVQRTITFKLIASAICIVGAIAVFVPFLMGWTPAVRFERERIDISVFPNLIEVDGIYEYRNPYPIGVIQGLAVPIPNDALHMVLNNVVVTDSWGVEVKTRKQEGGDVLAVAFFPFERKQIRVNYRQQCKVPNATYILSTTKPWKRPLQSGLYTLTEHDTQLVNSNYQTTEENGMRVWRRRNFMPDRDWHFAWRNVLVDSTVRTR